MLLFRETVTETTHLAKHQVAICMSYFTTGDPGKEHRTNQPPPTRRIQERSTGERRCQFICPSRIHLGLSFTEIHLDWTPHVPLSQRQPRNESYHHKTWSCKPHSRAVLPGPLTLLSAEAPLSDEVFVSMCVSSDNSFPSVTLGSWKGSPFLLYFLPSP